jgi:hypothetical protein
MTLTTRPCLTWAATAARPPGGLAAITPGSGPSRSWTRRPGLGGGVEANPGPVGPVGDPLGPENGRQLATMPGRRRAVTTGTPSMTTLPQGPGRRPDPEASADLPAGQHHPPVRRSRRRLHPYPCRRRPGRLVADQQRQPDPTGLLLPGGGGLTRRPPHKPRSSRSPRLAHRGRQRCATYPFCDRRCPDRFASP